MTTHQQTLERMRRLAADNYKHERAQAAAWAAIVNPAAVSEDADHHIAELADWRTTLYRARQLPTITGSRERTTDLNEQIAALDHYLKRLGRAVAA